MCAQKFSVFGCFAVGATVASPSLLGRVIAIYDCDHMSVVC